MTIEPWYSQLITPLESIYNDIIIIEDHNDLCKLDEIVSVLSKDFVLLFFQNELKLRFAISEIKERKILIIISNYELSRIKENKICIPYDIESRAEIIEWNLEKIFPKLHCQTITTHPMHLQEIFTMYKKIEGSLTTANADETKNLIQSWVKSDPRCKEIIELVKTIQQSLQPEVQNWDIIAPLWGRLSYLKDFCSEQVPEYYLLDNEITEKFDQFIQQKYADSFFALSKDRPITINKVMDYLGYLKTDKLLLICFDGMSFQEWNILKTHLEKHGISKFREDSVLALLPTITEFSRRSLYSGVKEYPILLEEERGFKKYIHDKWYCADSKQVGFYYNAKPEWVSEYENYDYIGIIINLFDDTAHATGNVERSKLLMQKNLINILQETHIENIFHEFLKAGYRVFITSDHGTVWCHGNEIIPDKHLVEEQAKRVLVYPNNILAEDYARQKRVKLLENKNQLGEKILVLPLGREMFTKKKESGISHGGIHLEEVIVPFIEVLP